jgi:hypothetical protein
MSVTLPNIDITFKQLATSFVERSERGIAILLIKDDTDKTFSVKEYSSLVDLESDETLFTATNYQYIADVLTFAANKVVVIRVDTTNTISDALALVQPYVKTGWITTVGTSTDYTTIVSWIKAKEALGETYKALVFNATTTPDCKHVANFVNTKVTFNDSRGEQTGDKYLPSLIGILAACNVDRGSTYFECTNLTSVTEVADNNTALNAGQFILINDTDTVKIGLGINSLTTFTTTNTEDMRFIDIAEAIDLIRDDVRDTFKNDFVGKYKNNIDNQTIFISAVNTYFKSLAEEEVLDADYSNYSDVDITAQRAAWVTINPEAAIWSDTVVRNTAYKRTVFLAGDVKILGSMENLKFNISMA